MKIKNNLFILTVSLSFLFGHLSSYAQENQVDAQVAESTASTTEDQESTQPLTGTEEEVVTLDSGNTAWMITATALVLFMTLPGLALFYGGLVQSKNVLSVLMHCVSIACIGSI